MSHSKKSKRGHSLYLENWNRSAERFINTCKICGHKGYSPAIEEPDFTEMPTHGAIRASLLQTYERLELDALGRCAICAKIQDGN